MLASISLFCFAVFSIWNYIIGSQRISLDKEKLMIANETYYWKDLLEAKLTGKIKIIGLLGFKSEGMVLRFRNVKPLYIIDLVYENTPSLKKFIASIISPNIEKHSSICSLKLNPTNEFFIDFKGNPFFSFRGVLMWGFAIFILYIFFIKPNSMLPNDRLVFAIPLLLFTIGFNAWQMHYFSMSKNFFKISNHYLFWKSRYVQINEIQEIVFETQPRQANMLRLITKDFESRVYPAGSLTTNNWLELKTEFESLGIKVRNECI